MTNQRGFTGYAGDLDCNLDHGQHVFHDDEFLHLTVEIGSGCFSAV